MKKLSFPEFTGFRLNPAEMKRISGGRYGVITEEGAAAICVETEEDAERLASETGGGICSGCC